MPSGPKNETHTNYEARAIPIRVAAVELEQKARGALSFAQGRFESVAREDFDDGWTNDDEPAAALQTHVTEERVRSII